MKALIVFSFFLFSACNFAQEQRGEGNQMKCDSEILNSLSTSEYEILVKGGTELPFQNAYWNEKRKGVYLDKLTKKPLFLSTDKFDSGTGWPSFTRPIEEEEISYHLDKKFNMTRTEIRANGSGGHLGHIFYDGPAGKGGLRYCVNSASLTFVPYDQLDQQGLGYLKEKFSDNGQLQQEETSVATVAGGCFWGMEELLRKLPGVLHIEVGYTGGSAKNPDYDLVKKGNSGHAEAVQLRFNPRLISYADILKYFFRIHDPTTLYRQGNDIGTQYRSAIFFHSAEQKKIALQVIEERERSGIHKTTIVTQLVPFDEFFPAEEYHQDYLQKHPGGYTCHYLRER